jgi:hypothetical protein
MFELIDRRARIMSDDFRMYWGIGKNFLTHGQSITARRNTLAAMFM